MDIWLRQETSLSPSTPKQHRLSKKLQLIVFPVSGIPSVNMKYLEKLSISFWWSETKKKQYNTYIEQWTNFCGKRQTDYSSQTIDSLEVLTKPYEKNISYSTLHVQLFHQFCTSKTVIRFMKGLNENRMPQPRCNKIWDATVVLKYLANLNESEML